MSREEELEQALRWALQHLGGPHLNLRDADLEDEYEVSIITSVQIGELRSALDLIGMRPWPGVEW